jgi:DNA-binding NarL/FixJ family response regulator
MVDDVGWAAGARWLGMPLTRCECDILAVSARGVSVSEVAGELGVTDHEVRAGLASAMHKLGARSKLEAVLIALRRGDIDP